MLECYLHNFKTYDIWEFDRHCYETKHKVEIWKNGKKTVKPFSKKHMYDNWTDPINRMNLAIAMYIEDNKRKKKKK